MAAETDFVVCVMYIDTDTDISKKKAEQKSALLALLKYNQINLDQIPENIEI